MEILALFDVHDDWQMPKIYCHCLLFYDFFPLKLEKSLITVLSVQLREFGKDFYPPLE
jgi:hypothetical protein